MPTPEELEAEAQAKIQAELEGGGGAPEGGAAPANEDEDAFAPVYKTAKELKAWRAENEPKLTTVQKQIEHLRTRISTKPYMQKALIELLESEDGTMDEQGLLAALQEALKAKPAGDKPASEQAAIDPKKLTEQILAQVREETQVKEIQRTIDATFARLPALIKGDTDFDGIEVDQAFLEDVETQLERDAAKGLSKGDDVKAEVLAAAKKVAATYHRIQGSVLQRQVAGGARKTGSATIPGKGGAGAAKVKPPNPDTHPDEYETYVAAKAKAIENEARAV